MFYLKFCPRRRQQSKFGLMQLNAESADLLQISNDERPLVAIAGGVKRDFPMTKGFKDLLDDDGGIQNLS